MIPWILTLGSCNWTQRRLCPFRLQSVPIDSPGNQRNEQVYWQELSQRIYQTLKIPHGIPLLLCQQRKTLWRTLDYDPVRTTENWMPELSRTHTPYLWSLNYWTNWKVPSTSPKLTFEPDTIMFGSRTVTNGKWPSKPAEDSLNPQSCSLECVTHQPHFRKWWMKSLPIRLEKDTW